MWYFPAVSILSLACLMSSALALDTGHPRLLFGKEDIPILKANALQPQLRQFRTHLFEHAERLLQSPPLLVSLTGRGEPDKPGELKGLEAARRLQGRVITFCMAFTLSGERRYRDAAVAELDHAIEDWKIWVDTAHSPPYDLMTGETCMTFGLAYDWLYWDLLPSERQRLREGVENRGLDAYLRGATASDPPFWFTAEHNWNPVCNGGAAVLALALEGESKYSEKVLELAIPAMKHYWDHLASDGGWDEGTGYWMYGHRYALLAAEALRRCAKAGGKEIFLMEGVRSTAYFPLVFDPGVKLAAGFGDSNHRAEDPIFYLLGREYLNPDFVWYQDRESAHMEPQEGWPQEAFTLLWRSIGASWLPEANEGFRPKIDPISVFPSVGWAFMAPSQPDPPYFLAFKNGSLAANHTHLDLNTLNVGFGDSMLVVELGSRPYPADYFHPERRYQYYEITTAGHNTVLIGGKGQVPGKRGSLFGPDKGAGYEALLGVADGTYELATRRVRRHVVFVNKRYWVILDEIATPEPQSVELRFHSYGKIAEMNKKVGWTIEQDEAALDVIPAMPEVLAGTVESPSRWIKPVKVLSLKARTESENIVIPTVLYPRGRLEPVLESVTSRQKSGELCIMIGPDEVGFQESADGWQLMGCRPR